MRKYGRNFVRLVSRLHVLLYRFTLGAFGGLASGAPVLLLTTTGRKTGRRFTIPLLFLPDGPDMVIVASYGGNPVDPQWWKNLKAQPRATVEVGHHHWSVEAEEGGPELKERLWPVFCRYYPAYQSYQDKTDRVIPLVLLRPV